MRMIIDDYGRSFKTLRISLINTCNFGCTYCTTGNEAVKENNKALGKSGMEAEGFIDIVNNLHQKLHFTTVRLTGGEPLLYQQLVPVISGIKALGIKNISLTTNGFLLEKMALKLKEAGLNSINVSLDAIDEDVFFLMSRRAQVQKVLDGIKAAISVGLKVKINTVLMKGLNDQQILPLLQFAFNLQIPIRFLEVMAMGHLYKNAKDYLLTRADILKIISTHYCFTPVIRKKAATANYWQTDNGQLFGIIANESAPFCHDCNRLRLDSNGNIYGCLSSNTPISIKGATEIELEEKLYTALAQKQSLKFKGSDLSMLQIGG